MKNLGEVEECFQKGLLKKTEKNKAFALQDLKRAEFFLKEASELAELGKKEMTLMALYNAVFHAARSLLFKDGVKERSHYCLQKYLEEEYEKTSLLASEDLALFELLRGSRNEVQYGLSTTGIEENLFELCNKTRKFVAKAEKILELE